MGKQFIPTLIETICWEAWTWEDVREAIPARVRHTTFEKTWLMNALKILVDSEGIEISQVDLEYTAFDIMTAKGSCATGIPSRQQLILAFLAKYD